MDGCRDGLQVPTLHELSVDQWYLAAEEGGLLFDDVGPFRNFGDIGDNERSEGQRKGNRRTLWANGNTPAQKHRKSQVLRWKEDGGGLGLGPGRALIAVRPALLVLIAWQDTVRGCWDDLDSEKGG